MQKWNFSSLFYISQFHLPFEWDETSQNIFNIHTKISDPHPDTETVAQTQTETEFFYHLPNQNT